jgi:hypothetical protein
MNHEHSASPVSGVTHSVPDIEQQENNLLTPEQKRQALRELLRRWREENKNEPEESMEELKKALDEDRPSYRKLFS